MGLVPTPAEVGTNRTGRRRSGQVRENQRRFGAAEGIPAATVSPVPQRQR
jgi:hypothetical protein